MGHEATVERATDTFRRELIVAGLPCTVVVIRRGHPDETVGMPAYRNASHGKRLPYVDFGLRRFR